MAGIKRLIVVNSPGMAGVPVEVLMASRPDPAWDAITVSYAPSAAMHAYLAGRPVPRDRPATLLAVADPAYPESEDDAPAPRAPPPDSPSPVSSPTATPTSTASARATSS